MTAVNWMIDALLKRHSGSLGKEYIKIFEQAKEMEKQQIKDAYGDGLNAYRTDFCNRDEYFAKTYGSKGSDETLKENHIVDTNEMVSSQTEISDDEIEKAADYFFPNLGESTKHSIWKMGARWYREQLKKK